MFRRLYQQFRSGKQPASLNKKFSLKRISNLNPLCSTCTAYLMSCQMPTTVLLTFCWMRPRMLSPNIKIYEKEWHTYLKPRTSTWHTNQFVRQSASATKIFTFYVLINTTLRSSEISTVDLWLVKFIYSEKATKLCEISIIYLCYVV